MYRFFKARGISLQNAYKTPNIQYSSNLCFFCNYCHRLSPRTTEYLQLRHQSSIINNAVLSSLGKRKLKRRTKKYVELLEVTESTTNNTKAAVQNLNAAQLSVLVDQPEITLDKLHKIDKKQLTGKNKNKYQSLFSTTSESSLIDQVSNSSKTNFSKFPSSFKTIKKSKPDSKLFELYEKDDKELLLEELTSSGIVDETDLIKSSSFVNSICESKEEQITNNTVHLEKRKKQKHLKESEENTKEKEHNAKEASIFNEKLKQFNKTLHGYIDVCVNSNVSSKANYLQMFYKKSNKDVYIDNILACNVQIEKYASNSDLKQILEILEYLRKENIKLNAQTYAYIFECIGRLNKSNQEKLELLKQIQMEMNKDEIILNDLITKTKFLVDQRDFVEKMIKLLDNHFEPIYVTPDLDYDCRLLNGLDLNNTVPFSTIEGLLTVDNLKDRLKKQIEMEVEGQVTVHNISKQNESVKNVAHWRNKLAKLEKNWEEVALNAFKRNYDALKNREKFNNKRSKMSLHPYLSVLKAEHYIRILMKEVRKLGMGSEMYSLPYNTLCNNLGYQVYKAYEANVKQRKGVNDKMSQVYLKYCNWFINRNNEHNIRTKWMLLESEANKHGVTLGYQVPSWPINIHTSIGKFLYNIIVNDLKTESNFTKKKKSHHVTGHLIPAFFKIFRHSGVMLKEEIKPHPIIAKLYRDSQPETLTFDTTLVPSLCPPRPWVSICEGGYIVSKTDIVRVTHMGNLQWDRLVNTSPKKLYPAFDSLNQLGSIPWTVNSSILDVAIKVFQNNGSVELNMPQPPSVLPPIQPIPKDASNEEKKRINKERIELKRKKNEMYSLWCDALYRLSLANHFRNEIFWLPHNMDFRGRVYPIPPHLNHLGSDLARSMLVFALKKPLGPKGLDWLKLHTINLTGFKKREPIRERLKYANEIMDKILDSAENPLTGEMWWATSDEPWQTLAACMEIAAALKLPNPEKFMSGFPIHQDGSCNGLQHYAALGRDQIGAKSVNLYPCDHPQDVYSSVATMVDELRKEDAKNGHLIANVLEGHIKRKVIKQTVMTTVYGVTWFGAKLQIARQLKDVDDFPQEHLWSAAMYLVQKTFQTLRTMFKSAREIQDWFTECARFICIVNEKNMEWQTPLGLPVVQPYSKVYRSTSPNSTSIFYTPDIYRKPNVMKQKNAFAPNFVHSLDSSHMMLTSIHCENVGLTFVSVHDCYWTHPCTVEIMNKICREQFVALHSEPILEDLSKFLIKEFGDNNTNAIEEEAINAKSNKIQLKAKLNSTLSKVPQKGDFDLKGVLSSTYFFS